MQEDGFFTIGVLGGKTEANIGTLWRRYIVGG